MQHYGGRARQADSITHVVMIGADPAEICELWWARRHWLLLSRELASTRHRLIRSPPARLNLGYHPSDGAGCHDPGQKTAWNELGECHCSARFCLCLAGFR
jgi:hypothetical protein